jgi:2-amino-4-hydroxy-6-hydroxymethyldihydropteridine diphosphokinase
VSALVYVSLGSNVDRENNIRLAVEAMRQKFGVLRLSPVYESAAVGFDGDDFLNLVAEFLTEFDVRAVVLNLREIEDSLGRDRGQPRFSPRAVDLDILTYGQLQMDKDGIQIPRHEILVNSFVLRPLQDLAPETLHPCENKSYAELWHSLRPAAVPTQAIELSLD